MVVAMTVLRWISLPVHGACELALGIALLVAPFGLGLTPAGVVVAVAVGALTVGLALSTTDARSGPAAHHASDLALAVLGLVAALGLALAGAVPAATLLLGAGLAQLGLTLVTRYSIRS